MRLLCLIFFCLFLISPITYGAAAPSSDTYLLIIHSQSHNMANYINRQNGFSILIEPNSLQPPSVTPAMAIWKIPNGKVLEISAINFNIKPEGPTGNCGNFAIYNYSTPNIINGINSAVCNYQPPGSLHIININVP